MGLVLSAYSSCNGAAVTVPYIRAQHQADGASAAAQHALIYCSKGKQLEENSDKRSSLVVLIRLKWGCRTRSHSGFVKVNMEDLSLKYSIGSSAVEECLTKGKRNAETNMHLLLKIKQEYCLKMSKTTVKHTGKRRNAIYTGKASLGPQRNIIQTTETMTLHKCPPPRKYQVQTFTELLHTQQQ